MQDITPDAVHRRLWAAAIDQAAERELVNPSETARTYSHAEDAEGGAVSVLGSRGEWKVASHDKSRWLALDLGSERCVHALVLQCGAIERTFSGWVTRLKVDHSSAEAPEAGDWTECREVLTGCGSDPMKEHCVHLHAKVYARHLRLTPVAWRVAGVLSTREDLEPHISMRAAVLVSVDAGTTALGDVYCFSARASALPRGTRVALASSVSRQEACGTVVGDDAQGRAVVSIDNTRTRRAFMSWAAGFFGKGARGTVHGVAVAPQPGALLPAPAVQHAPGTRLLVLREGALLDATVSGASLGAAHGSTRELELPMRGRAIVDLNALNHCVNRFESAAAFESARQQYCAAVAARGAWVEDAITGRVLKIEDQLLNITMATGAGAVAMDAATLAKTPAADLVWTRGAPLTSGDRVRHRGRLGYVGFKNDESATLSLGKADGAARRFCCGRERDLGGGGSNGKCGGLDGSGPLCQSCRRFNEENAPLLDAHANPRLHHIELDGTGLADGVSAPTRTLLLAHDVEKASCITGVHRPEWTGSTFQSGDQVVVEAGHVTHVRSRKTVPLAYAYSAVALSTLPAARSATVELERDNVARRVRGSGGSVISAEPIPLEGGEATFEVVIKAQGGEGDEGLEVGVTTCRPDNADMNRSDYCAATIFPNWVSSDSGSLWIDQRAMYSQGQWATTRPTALKAGDVVQVSVLSSGALRIHCNGVLQACWHAARIPQGVPLYAIVGMRAPLRAVLLRRRAPPRGATLPAGSRTLTLRGIEGRPGETVDLSKHGRPRYPAAFANTLYLSDVRSLFPLLLDPDSFGRPHGRSGAQPVLIRAGPGTGKTWCILQLQYFLAREWRCMPSAQKLPALARGLLQRATHLAHGLAAHAARLALAPCVIYVQKLAQLMRGAAVGGHGGGAPDGGLLRLYVDAELAEGTIDALTHRTLLQLHELRALIVLVDGIDEAADLKEVVEDWVTQELVPLGHPVVVTSRPEGVRLRLYARDFVVMNLQPLTREQQAGAIGMQLEGSEFFDRLSKISAIRTRHDDIYCTAAFPVEADRGSLEAFKARDAFVLGAGLGFDPAMRTRNAHGAPIGRQQGAPRSAFLRRLCAAFTPTVLGAVDAALATAPPAVPADEHARLSRLLCDAAPQLSAADLEVAVRLAELLAQRRLAGAEGRRGSKRPRGEEARAGVEVELMEVDGDGDGAGGAAELWHDICERTDELYEVAEAVEPRFVEAVRALFGSLGQDPDTKVGSGPAFRPGSLKDPVRLHSKSATDYAGRFDDGVLPEACVLDAVRGLAVFTSAAGFRKMAEALQRGFVLPTPGGGALRLELVRCKNLFKRLDPTHFRRLQLNVALHVEPGGAGGGGPALRFFCELQLIHRFVLGHNEASAAQQHYEFFRAHLRDYETELSTNLDLMLEERIRTFDKVGGTPVLLSMLILVLGEQGCRRIALPPDIHGLYTVAIRTAIIRHVGIERAEAVTAMLRTVAAANHLARRRTFSLADARDVLAADTAHLALWEELMRSGTIPLVKVLALGDASGEFQFKHLSFQEALFVSALVRGEASTFWATDQVAAQNLTFAFITAWSKWPSWWRHSWPPRAPQTASEGLGLPLALVERGPAGQIPPRGRGLSDGGHPRCQFRCV